MSDISLIDVAVRWEAHGWVAYNIGPRPLHASKFWSTAIGPAEIDEVFDLFRNSNLTFLPALEK